ncbi:MAG: hypothetical protein ACFFG0_53475 [Candidatus Thorarchaeota archaeon]
MTLAILGFIGVAICSYLIIQSIITIATTLNVHEYIISFFILGLGTSLPELVVDINALYSSILEPQLSLLVSGYCSINFSTICSNSAKFFFSLNFFEELTIKIRFSFFIIVYRIFLISKLFNSPLAIS